MILQEGSAYMAGLTPLSTRNGQLRAFMQGSSELFVFRWKMLLLTRIRNTIQETSTRGKSGLGQGSAPPGNSFDSQASRPMRKSRGVSGPAQGTTKFGEGVGRGIDARNGCAKQRVSRELCAIC